MSGEPTHTSPDAWIASFEALTEARGASLQLIYDTAPIGLAFLSPDCRYLQINKRLTEICGIPVESHLGRTVRECVPSLADAVEAVVNRVIETGEPVTGIELTAQRADQPEPRSWVTYWHPVRAADNTIIGINVAAEEITERKRTEEALRASEQRFRTLADSIPQLVWMSDPEGRIFWFNRQLAEFAKVPIEDIAGRDWVTVLAPDIGCDEWHHSRANGSALEMEVQLRREDEQRAFLTRIVPVHNSGDAVHRWIGTHIDISEQKRREEHVRFVSHEMSHRSKNLLAVVTAIAQQTARHADDIRQYHKRFGERLAALAHAHDLLVKESWYGASFCDLIATQLRPFTEADRSRIEAAGPALVLRPTAVQYLALAFHELATNASKHGALSGVLGHVSIHWAMDEPRQKVQLHWTECDGPAVAPPQRHGFGQVVIEQIVPRALKGNGALLFPPEGVRWIFEFPAQECENVSAPIAPGWPEETAPDRQRTRVSPS